MRSSFDPAPRRVYSRTGREVDSPPQGAVHDQTLLNSSSCTVRALWDRTSPVFPGKVESKMNDRGAKRLKVLNERVQFVLLAIVAQSLWCNARTVAGNRELEAMPGTWPQQSVVGQTAVEARDLPMDQYVRLRTSALSSATSRMGPRIKNPRVSTGGLDPAVLTILEQQRAYLRTHSAAVRQAPSDANRSTTLDSAQHRDWNGKPAPAPQLEHSPMPGPGISGAGFASPSCLNPMIAVVNGRGASAVFTPQLPDNLYRIEGCGFGEKPGEIQLEPDLHVVSLAHTQPIKLQLERPGAWSETEIDVRVDPRLSGIPDSAVTLVVHLADGRRAELPGCRFIAARGEPTPLTTVAASWVTMNATVVAFHPIAQLEYVSPPAHGREVPHDAAGMSALVIRSDPNAFIGASDFYNFSALNPGWVVESIEIQMYSITCPGDVTRAEQAGTWDAHFGAHGFTVDWASSSCFSFIPPIFRFRMGSSEYAVKVWVIGPIGTEPMGVGSSQHNQKHD